MEGENMSGGGDKESWLVLSVHERIWGGILECLARGRRSGVWRASL